MFRRFIFAASLVAAVFAFGSCEQEVNTEAPTVEVRSGELQSLQSLYDELSSLAAKYQASNPDLAAQIIEYRDNVLADNIRYIYAEESGDNAGFGSLSDILNKTKSKIATDTLRYTSLDGSGKPITISGVIHYLPNAAGVNTTVKGVVIGCHATMPQTMSLGELDEAMDETGGGGGTFSMMNSLYSVKTLATAGFAVFEPDYIGFGCTSNVLQTYLCQKLIARNCADMIEPAFEHLRQVKGENIVANCPTYIVGYSQGGGQALALTRELTLNRPALLNEINLKYSFCGAGPYDPEATFQYWLDINHIGLSVLLPMVLAGFTAGHPDIMAGVDINDYFCEYYRNTGIPDDVLHITGNPFMDGMFFDMNNADEGAGTCVPGAGCNPVSLDKIAFEGIRNLENPLVQKLHACLKDEIVCSDWTPVTKVCLFCEQGDNIVPPVNTSIAYDALHTKVPSLVDRIYAKGNDHILGQIAYLQLLTGRVFKAGEFHDPIQFFED